MLSCIIIIAVLYGFDSLSAFYAKDTINPLGFPIKIFQEEYICNDTNCHQIATILIQRKDYSYTNIIRLSNWYIETKRRSASDSFNLHFSTRSEEAIERYKPQDDYPWLTVRVKQAIQNPYDAFLYLSSLNVKSDGSEVGYLSYRPILLLRPYFRTVSVTNPAMFLSIP